MGGGRYHQVLTPDEIQVEEVEDDDIHRATGKEDDVTIDVQAHLDVVPSSSYLGFVELINGCLDYEYINQPNNSTCLHSFYGEIDFFCHNTNHFHFTVEFEKGNPISSVATPTVGGRDFWVVTS